MSIKQFERYQPQERSESDCGMVNERVAKKVKIVPVQIIENKCQSSNERPKYPKLNLRFQTAEEEQSTHENGTVRHVPTVTIPLSFLQQLLYQAQQNKQLRALHEKQAQVTANNTTTVDEVIKQIQNQQQTFMKPVQSEEDKFQKELLQEQMLFVKNSDQAKQIINLYFLENPQLLPHFDNWMKSIEVQAMEDMLVLCTFAESKSPSYQDIFKSLFQKLSFEYYSKHAYITILRSGRKDKLKYLSSIGEIAQRIAKPSEYYYFGKK